MTTKWQIFDTKYQISNGLVIKVVYGCTAQLENHIDRVVEELELTGDPTSPDFVPYENLTEEMVKGWVMSALGTEKVSAIEQQVQSCVIARKAAQENITETHGLPWVN